VRSHGSGAPWNQRDATGPFCRHQRRGDYCRRGGGEALRSQRGGDCGGVECKGRGENREGNDDRRDRLSVFTRGWRRNVGKTPGPQTALRWAMAAVSANRAAKRRTQPFSKQSAQPVREGDSHAPQEGYQRKLISHFGTRGECAVRLHAPLVPPQGNKIYKRAYAHMRIGAFVDIDTRMCLWLARDPWHRRCSHGSHRALFKYHWRGRQAGEIPSCQSAEALCWRGINSPKTQTPRWSRRAL
jgi:hypothetical protein